MSTRATSKPKRQTSHKTFGDHIGELRFRLTWVAIVFMVASGLAYYWRQPLIDLVLAPLGDQKLMYLTPAGGFAFIFQITMYAGAVVTAPLLVYHLYRFVKPALPPRATRYSLRILFVSVALMLGGVAFGYFVAVPAALQFLTSFAGDFVIASLTADSYLNFIMAYVVGLGILFQLPLLLVFWNWISPLGPGKLLDSQRFVILFAFIAAAMITPTPDVVNQSLVAGPIIAIYQFGVVAVYIMNRRQRRQAGDQRASAPIQTTSRTPTVPKVAYPTKKILDVSRPVPGAGQPISEPAQTTLTPKVVTSTSSRPVARPRSIDGFMPPAGSRSSRLTAPTRPAVVQRPIPRLQRSSNRVLSLDGISRAV